MFAIRKDGNGCRAIESPSEVTEDEVLSETVLDNTSVIETAIKIQQERTWRDLELRKTVDLMDQIRNDSEFGTTTYTGPIGLRQLNEYRVLLCNYPGTKDFPWGQRPTLPE